MRKSFCLAVITSLMCAPISYAAETDLTAVIARLERLEKENAELKQKVSSLEKEKAVGKIDQKKLNAGHSPNSATTSNIGRIQSVSSSSTASNNSKWDGFFTQISTGYEYNKITNTGMMDNNYVAPSSANYFLGSDAHSTSVPLRLDVGYYGAITHRYLLGVGLEYSVFGQKSSYPNYTDLSRVISGRIRFETSGRRSAFISPAYAIDDKSIIYAKLGISQQDWKIVRTHVGNAQLGGVVGVGYKRFVYDGLYGFTEVNYYSYGESSKDLVNTQTQDIVNFRPGGNAYNVVLGVGYKY